VEQMRFVVTLTNHDRMKEGIIEDEVFYMIVEAEDYLDGSRCAYEFAEALSIMRNAARIVKVGKKLKSRAPNNYVTGIYPEY
jgi:hypothetical protein